MRIATDESRRWLRRILSGTQRAVIDASARNFGGEGRGEKITHKHEISPLHLQQIPKSLLFVECKHERERGRER